jgi:dimeric dUTPase (all-alpha-NTP-PPase superfamily)
MNLQYLFEIQDGLDRHIEDEHPRQPGEDRLAKKILALQVELGELANEWRGFKFWKKYNSPRTIEYNGAESRNPLLEEYVDCLHFILSIGLEMKFNQEHYAYLHEGNIGVFTEIDTIKQFLETFQAITALIVNEDLEAYEELFLCFIGLGRHMVFTWEQIEQAYLEKNKVNHERQVNGY